MSQTTTSTKLKRTSKKHKDEKSVDSSSHNNDSKSNKKHKGSTGTATHPRIDVHKYDNPLVGYHQQYTGWFQNAMADLQLWIQFKDAIPIVYSYLVFSDRFLPTVGQNRQLYEHAISMQFMLYDMSISDFTPLESMYWFLGLLRSGTFSRINNDALLGLVSSDYETLNSLIGLQDIRVLTQDRPRTRSGDIEYNPFDHRGDVRSGYLRRIRYGIEPPPVICRQLGYLYIDGRISVNRYYVEFLFDSGLLCPKLYDFEFDKISVCDNAYLELAQELLKGGQLVAFQMVQNQYKCDLSRMTRRALSLMCENGVYGFEWEFGRCSKLNKQQTRTLRYLLENTYEGGDASDTSAFDFLADVVSNWHMPAWERDATLPSKEELALEQQQEIIDDNVVDDWNEKDDEERKLPFVVPPRLVVD